MRKTIAAHSLLLPCHTLSMILTDGRATVVIGESTAKLRDDRLIHRCRGCGLLTFGLFGRLFTVSLVDQIIQIAGSSNGKVCIIVVACVRSEVECMNNRIARLGGFDATDSFATGWSDKRKDG
jgi:hypothetical protein